MGFYAPALLGSLLLHALLAAFLSSHWQPNPPQPLPPARPIQATLVDLKKLEPKTPAPKVIDLAAQREKQRQQAAAERKKRAQQQAAAQRKKREQEAAKKKRAAEQQRQQATQARQAEFTRALEQEQAYQTAQAEQQQIAAVGQQIEQAVEQQWSRPPSARRGMQAVLRVSLVPTGALTAVTVLESSGDPAFDRSATQAVHRAAPFTAVRDLPAPLFERNFRHFQFLFNPQDLRL